MPWKRELKIQLEEARREGRELFRRNSDLESRVAFLESRIEEKDLIIEALEKRIKDSGTETFPNLASGDETQVLGWLTAACHYLLEEGKDPSKAEWYLDRIFSARRESKIAVRIYEDNERKTILSLDKILQDKVLKAIWCYVRHDDREDAQTVYTAYQGIIAARPEPGTTDLVTPRIPQVKLAGRYLAEHMVIGQDLFKFFLELEKRPATPAKEALVDQLVRRQLEDAAYIRTRDYPFRENHAAKTNHPGKILEVLDEAGIQVTRRLRERVYEEWTPLDDAARYRWSDRASWNLAITQEAAMTFLSEGFLNGEPDHDSIRETINANVYSLPDLDTLKRRTFQSDEAIHAVEWPVPLLDPKRRAEHERYFIAQLARNNEDTSNYWQSRRLGSAYRHLRMWRVYNKGQSGHLDPDGAYRQHHLRMTYAVIEQNLQDRRGRRPDQDFWIEKAPGPAISSGPRTPQPSPGLATITVQDVINLIAR
jgi:hypothetical protein